MHINFINIKYAIIFTLLQYSSAMVLKSLTYYNTSRYIKKPFKTTFYIHNPYKARKNLDYKYQDWEDKMPDIYDYLVLMTNHTSTTNHASEPIINETSRQEMFKPETITNPILESSQYDTLYSSTDTYPTLPSNESTPDTSLPTSSIDSTPLSILSSFFTPYNTTTTTLTPEISTENIIIEITTPLVLVPPISESIRDEINEAKVKLRGGYFTASVYVFLKIIEKKKSEDLTPLLIELEREITRLNSDHRLAMFGPMVTSILINMVWKVTSGPSELIQIQAKDGQGYLENKREAFKTDINAVFDVIDTIYTEEDFIHIVESLTDIQKFPNVSKRGFKVAEEAIDALIFRPYTRIEGTMKEKLLLMELSNFFKKRMTVRQYFRNHVKMTTGMTYSETKFRGKKFTKAQIRKKFVWPTIYMDPTTIHSSETDYKSYVIDSKNVKRLRHKMKIYKHKFRQSRGKERKFKTNRELTSTTITTTTTVIPQMHKSKYYMRKYVKTYVYKMKISAPKTTRITWNYGTDAIKSMTPTKFENNIVKGEEFATKIENMNIIQSFNHKTDSSDSNAESYLQVNLNDAFFHTNNITFDKRFITKKVNKLIKMEDSFSDYEAIIKGNIYKAFGYSNDFAKQLRAMV